MKISVYVFCLSVLFCTSAFATLATIDAAYVGIDAGGKQGVILNGSNITGANGVMAMDTQNPAGELAELLGDHVWGYCYELGQYASTNFSTFDVELLEDAIASDKAGLIRQLWELHYDDSWEADTLIFTDQFVSGEPADTTENQEALAFSFAIYEIIYDYDGNMNHLDLGGGDLQSSIANTIPPQAAGIAQSWLNGLVDPGLYTGPLAKLVSLKNDSKQDVIVEIPEPATMSILVLGSLALLRKRRV